MSGLIAVTAFLVGAIVMALVFVMVMRSKMLVAHRSHHSFDETEKRIKQAIPSLEGWGMPMEDLHFSEVLAGKGLPLPDIKQAKILFLCNPQHARDVVTADPKLMGMMPCSWALYEMNSGGVYLAGMNIPLMSKMFTGVVGEVMGKVGAEETKMLEALR